MTTGAWEGLINWEVQGSISLLALRSCSRSNDTIFFVYLCIKAPCTMHFLFVQNNFHKTVRIEQFALIQFQKAYLKLWQGASIIPNVSWSVGWSVCLWKTIWQRGDNQKSNFVQTKAKL